MSDESLNQQPYSINLENLSTDEVEKLYRLNSQILSEEHISLIRARSVIDHLTELYPEIVSRINSATDQPAGSTAAYKLEINPDKGPKLPTDDQLRMVGHYAVGGVAKKEKPRGMTPAERQALRLNN